MLVVSIVKAVSNIIVIIRSHHRHLDLLIVRGGDAA